MVASQHCLPYDISTLDPLMKRFDRKLGHLVSVIADQAIMLLLTIMIDMIMVILDDLDEIISKEIIPKRAVRFLWRHIAVLLEKPLHIRDRLAGRAQREIGEKMLPVYESIMATGTFHDTLNQNLWIEEFSTTIDMYLRQAVHRWKWEATIAIVSSAFQDGFESGDIPLQSSIQEKGFAQLILACRAALPAGMTALRDYMTPLNDTESDDDVFDKCWSAAREATLTSVKSAIEATFSSVNNRWQEAAWVKVWEVWDRYWDLLASGVSVGLATST